jgi:UDP-N-acetylglucosamine 2-epimerase
LRVLSVVGARPQFVKAAMVSRVLRKKHEEILLHTGQHYDYEMSKAFFDVMSIPEPDYNLGVGSGPHGWQIAKMLAGIEEVHLKVKPDCVLVYGDTNSTLAGALAAAKLHVSVAHVEAGLRSFNMSMPEEVNRRLTDHISSILFCPTSTAVKNLKNEGIRENVHLVGDVMYDAALAFEKVKSDILARLRLKPKGYYLLTVHRASNTDRKENLKAVLDALAGLRVIFPAHPRTMKLLKEHKLRTPANVKIIKPVNYVESIHLIKNAKKLLTDSGGMQKEAYFFGVPCITLREETEWVETVKDGWNTLTGPDEKKIRQAIKNFEPSGKRPSSYGDGRASEKLVRILEKN